MCYNPKCNVIAFTNEYYLQYFFKMTFFNTIAKNDVRFSVLYKTVLISMTITGNFDIFQANYLNHIKVISTCCWQVLEWMKSGDNTAIMTPASSAFSWKVSLSSTPHPPQSTTQKQAVILWFHSNLWGSIYWIVDKGLLGCLHFVASFFWEWMNPVFHFLFKNVILWVKGAHDILEHYAHTSFYDSTA